MKYIDSEKLISEIERLLKCTELHRGEAVVDGSRQTLYWIKDFIDSLQKEQPDLPSGEDVMTMCNQILIDWAKEGKTQEEIEQRKQAHSRFFELYDDYLMQEQPEVDIDIQQELYHHFGQVKDFTLGVAIASYFYELGQCKARKEE
jgi:hypothetical protein